MAEREKLLGPVVSAPRSRLPIKYSETANVMIAATIQPTSRRGENNVSPVMRPRPMQRLGKRGEAGAAGRIIVVRGRMLAQIAPLDAADDLAQRRAQAIGQLSAAQNFAAGHGIGERLVEPPANDRQRVQEQHVHGFGKAALQRKGVGGTERDGGRL